MNDRRPGPFGTPPPLRWQALLVFALAVAAYALTLPYPLVWDDVVVAEQAAGAARQDGLPGLLRTKFGAEDIGYYRPVVLLSFQLDAALARIVPFAHHLTNAHLHAFNATLVTLLAGDVIGPDWGSLFAGLLFALPPVHVESVAFGSRRTYLWASLFLLPAVLACPRHGRWVAVRALAHTSLGNALQERLRPDEALAKYAAAVRIDPGFGAAHLGWGEVLMKTAGLRAILGGRRASARACNSSRRSPID
jgi:hypothetical protein